jgi:hypothetical protein
VGQQKLFGANPWKYYFLLACLDCYVNNVGLSCLLNNIVNQHNPCAPVVMPLFMFLAVFPEPLSWQPLHFPNYVIFPKQEPRFIFETKLLSKLSICKIIRTYKVEWSHYLTNLYFVDIIKGFQTPLRKLSKGDVYVSTSF